MFASYEKPLYGLTQSPRAWFGRFGSVLQSFGMTHGESDHIVFYRLSSTNQCIYLVVYVDDIVITGDDHRGVRDLKNHLSQHFQTKDLGQLKYLLGIEVTQSKTSVAISQRKYARDILEDIGMVNCVSLLTLPWIQIPNLYQIRGSPSLIQEDIEDWLGS